MERPSWTGAASHFESALDSPVLSMHDQRMQVLELTIQLLIVRTSMDEYWHDGLRDVQKLLAALPLPKAKYRAAARCLRNTKVYCDKHQFGAANCELRTWRGHLQRL